MPRQSKTNKLWEKIKLPWFYQLLFPGQWGGYSRDSLDEKSKSRKSPENGSLELIVLIYNIITSWNLHL